jgi:iron complex outermembrane recepter protein
MWRMTFAVMLLFASTRIFSQFNLQGKIMDEHGDSLVGANILLKNTGIGTISGANGKFLLTAVKRGNYTLVVSFIGYEKYEQRLKVEGDLNLDIRLDETSILGDDIIVTATRAGSRVPVAYTNLDKEQISVVNMGQDIPYLLAITPSFVSTSDAGAGVGYTGFRIRGTDANRINVTINGVPLNDAESHSVYWVDLPDFSSSLQSLQIQRGVGTSTNGAGAFGGSINMETSSNNNRPYAELSLAAGSFNTYKSTIRLGTGLLNERFNFDIRLSKITSDGYVDRGWSDLKSLFVTGSYHTEKSILKLNIFSGKELTYQAWNGVPSYMLETNRTYNPSGEYTGNDGQTHFYNNETDNYQQDHYQLFYTRKFNPALSFNLGLHYTYGRGYYENYKADREFLDYGLSNIILGDTTLETTDMIQQKWLDNDFYGTTFSAIYQSDRSEITIGGAWNQYDGRHFGRVIWAEYMSNGMKDYEWYRGTGIKTDYNVFGKYNYLIGLGLNIYTDIQYRHITHKIGGIDDDLRDITQTHTFDFFNPKVGLFYQRTEKHSTYILFAIGNREPNRSNYTDAAPDEKPPVSERLYNYEAGYCYKTSTINAGVNLYYMDYKDQLILTGEINDVGSPIMVNASKSSRKGIEVTFSWKPSHIISFGANTTLSKSLINGFTEYVDAYDADWNYVGQVSYDLGKTEIAFSPKVLVSGQVVLTPIRDLSVWFIANYVGKQYIDNSSSEERILEPYLINNCKIQYSVSPFKFGSMNIHLLLNNLFNVKYESNAWVYSYLLGQERQKMDGYFPQAGFHCMAGIDINF